MPRHAAIIKQLPAVPRRAKPRLAMPCHAARMLPGLDLPSVRNAADIATAMMALTTAMASGDLTPDEAATVASVLEIRRKVLETEELELRLQALEEKGRDR